MQIKIKNIRYMIAYILIAVGLIYCSGHSYSPVGSAKLKVFMFLVCAIGCFTIKPTIHRLRTLSSVNITIITTAIGALLSFIFNLGKNVWLDPILLLGMMFVSNEITEKIDFNSFRKLYADTLCALVIVAVIVSIIVNTVGDIPSVVFENSREQTYHTIWVCTWISDETRIMGPFWEPGLFSTFLLLGIVFEVIIGDFERKRLGVILVLIVGVIASQSTAGYLLLALVLYIWFHKSRKIQVIWDIIAVALVFLGLYFQDYIAAILYGLNQDIFWKLTETSITGNTRLMSPIICFKVFMENPFTGNGLSLAAARYNELKASVEISKTSIDSLTSTNFFYLSAFGVWGISYTVCWITSIWKQKNLSIMIRILLLVMFLIVLNKEPHYNIMVMYIILFYLSKNIVKKQY